MIELGGNIKLTGFREVDSGSMVILKKIIGNYARKMSDKCGDFEALEMSLKKVHETSEHPKYEVHSRLLDGGKSKTSEVTERNLFVGVDSSLRKVLNALDK